MTADLLDLAHTWAGTLDDDGDIDGATIVHDLATALESAQATIDRVRALLPEWEEGCAGGEECRYHQQLREALEATDA